MQYKTGYNDYLKINYKCIFTLNLHSQNEEQSVATGYLQDSQPHDSKVTTFELGKDSGTDLLIF